MKSALLILILSLTVLTACQSTVDEHADHLGCSPNETTPTGCAKAPDGETNTELFSKLKTVQVSTTDAQYSPTSIGFLSKPTKPGTYPGIIMIHEFWGLNDHIKDMARLLSDEGYVVLAVDLYDGIVANDSTQARELSSAARKDPARTVANMKSAAAYLRSLPDVDGNLIGSMGWCFGGAQSLLLAMSGEPMAATVIYYGQLVNSSTNLSTITWPVLGVFGENDTGIPVPTVRAFESTLTSLGNTPEIHIYPGVGHAFANPSGARYAPAETIDAWNKTVSFLERSLKGNAKDKQQKTMPADRTFSITGENFKFLMNGTESPELRVKKGERVRVELTSTKGLHDFVVDEFNVKTLQIRSNESTYVDFVADRTGTFEYYCSVGKHRQNGMKGKLIVE